MINLNIEYSSKICVYSNHINTTAIGKYSSLCIWWLIFVLYLNQQLRLCGAETAVLTLIQKTGKAKA